MKEKKSLITELNTRKIKKAPLTYHILKFIGKYFVYRKHNIKIFRKIDVKKFKGPYILVSNHQSRADYAYVSAAIPHRLNFVAAYNEFFRSHTAGTLKAMGAIPKRSYYPDFRMIKKTERVLKDGGRIMIFPEGEATTGGANQPVLPASGKFLKYFKVPVLFVKLRGSHLTNPKFSLLDRPGRVEVEVDSLFTVKELEELTASEVQEKLDKVLYHDEYEWNKTARNKYNGRGRIAENMHQVLYWCPKCKKKFTMLGQGNTIKCTACGNGATVNEYYDLIPFDESCVIPETPRVWFDMQREEIKKQIAAPDFSITEKVSLGMLDTYNLIKNRKTSLPAGTGEIIISHDGFSYHGTKNGADFSFTIAPADIMSFAYITDMQFFALYYNEEMYEFTPGRQCCQKCRFAVEELHRLHGGKWASRELNQ